MEERLKKYLQAFDEYVSDYDFTDEKIILKYEHSLRVMELSKKYAKLLNFSEEDIELATLIGLLHDIGRFEQIRVFGSFNDLNTVDHADYSVEELFKKGKIKKFTDNEEWYPIIKFAIKEHNKFEISDINNERILMHARLIRDTDKVDIMRAIIGKIECDDSKISPKIKIALKNHQLSSKKDVVTKNDLIANQYGFVFNIYNDLVLEEYKENFMELHKSLDSTDDLNEIYNDIMEYIERRINYGN